MLPSVAFHETDLLDAVPWTAAVNGSVPLVTEAVETGEMVTELTHALVIGSVTFTVATADLVGSTMLVAVTVTLPAPPDAVYNPVPVIVPIEAFQATDLS